jgi:hypothetical protein
MLTANEISNRMNGKKVGNEFMVKCPAHNDRNPSLAIRESDGKVLAYCHAGCSQANVIEGLRGIGISITSGSSSASEKKSNVKVDAFRKILSECFDIVETEAEPLRKYIIGRGISKLSQFANLKFHPNLRYSSKTEPDSYHPAMVAEVRNQLGEIVAIHRTYLTEDGLKANVTEQKKALGPIKGAAVQLWTADAVGSLTEGIETAHAIFSATGLATWATVSANGMKDFDCPERIEKVHVWLDRDRSETGRKAAEHLAARLVDSGKVVYLHSPMGILDEYKKGIDWLDIYTNSALGPSVIAEALQNAKPWARAPNEAANSSWKNRATKKTFELMPLSDLLSKPVEDTDYLVQDSLVAAGTSVWVGKPKAGKTTLIRYLAFCVAGGCSFLGKDVRKGRVIYLALEEKESQVKQHFADMGATGAEDILIHASFAPTENVMDQFYDIIVKYKPSLVIVDTLFKLVPVKDVSDYAAVNRALEPISNIARETGAHILLVHHMGKMEREGSDGVLGSTAIAGAVDAIFMLKRAKQKRTISSQQRYGIDLEESLLIFDSGKRTFALGDTVEGETDGDIDSAILMFLRERAEPVIEKEIHDFVQGKKITKVHALRDLVKRGEITRAGKGGKGAPFTYSYPQDSSEDFVSAQEQGNKEPELVLVDDAAEGLS